MSTAKILYGALAGVATGLAIGILTAPDSGEETRRKIKRGAHRFQGNINKILGKGSDGLSELKYIFENEASGLKNDVRERILTLIDESLESYGKFKKEVTS
ncbi:Gas vesicle protein [Chitinophaga sp. CF118]|uniref:YtxH domain-containing protein n=1 Tax=Chitinophaga sp. CF118 TaxID=1884367 RepID=UPI0008F3C038|nr:YtxH domain-containing protein [Chitinophaga sp. CF118]SFE85731.1 Gas vesicle protein [Chitinophaga sp. CF118]